MEFKLVNELKEILKSCVLCPRKCKVNRLKGERGFCQGGMFVKISSFFLHFGEERELVGEGGSGTIFFSGCNLGCIYCQNFSISLKNEGEEITIEDLSKIMFFLQEQGAENINLVTPTHYLPQIIEAFFLAKSKGLNLPLVYNCGGYENVEIIKKLRGIIDIYMPDIKYAKNEIALKYSGVYNYWEVVKEVVKEMYQQVGDLVIENQKAKKGLLIRHLVLPNQQAGSFEILDFIAKEISRNTYINIMDQYYPCYRAFEFKEISRTITFLEYQEVLDYAKKVGLWRGF